MKLFELIQNKLDLMRIEKRYTLSRHRRSTFVSDALYRDGEYVYDVSAKPSQHTGSSSNSKTSKNSTNTNSITSTNGSMGEEISQSQRNRGNSLILEVNAELERSEREEEMEVDDMIGKVVPSDGSDSAGIERLPERKKKNRLSRISVRELKWDTEKGR